MSVDSFLMTISSNCTKLAIKDNEGNRPQEGQVKRYEDPVVKAPCQDSTQSDDSSDGEAHADRGVQVLGNAEEDTQTEELGQYEVVNQDSPDEQRKVFHYPSLPFSCLCLSTCSFQILKPAMMKPMSMKAPGGNA